MPDRPLLSLILPTHNGAGYIERSLQTVCAALAPLDARGWEVIVVCDGSTDGTAQVAEQVRHPQVTVLRNDGNQGKGQTILHGASVARGRLIGWLDADLDISPQAILDAVALMDERRLDVALGSKRHPASEVHYPLLRRVYSTGFQLLVRLLFRFNVRDTQVGAKVFRREVLDIAGPLMLVKRYAFDLELLAVAAEFGFDRVGEVPIRLQYQFTGSGINTVEVRRMFVDVLAIGYRIHIRHHYTRRFAALQRQRMDEAGL